MDLNRFIAAEAQTITNVFRAHRVGAGTLPEWTTIAGSHYLIYPIGRSSGVGVDQVERLADDLNEAVSALRQCRTVARLRKLPLSVELPHPRPQPLSWRDAPLALPPHTALLGRSYSAAGHTDELLRLDDTAHLLIGGITGAGKSTLMRMVLSSLSLNTPPAGLRFVVVDLKNEDMLPYRHLPHTLQFAGTLDAARDAVASVHAEMLRRIDTGSHPYRLVLVIDEIARFAGDKQIMAMIADLAGTGRSKQINLLAATQHPTAQVIGSLTKANFTTRLCGRVADSNAAVLVTGQADTAAHQLPGRGAFLRVDENGVTRIQAYYVTDADAAILVRSARAQWRATAQAAPALPPPPPALPAPSAPATAATGPTTEQIAATIRPRYLAGGWSLSDLIREAFGPEANRGGANLRRIKRALALLESDGAATATATPAQAPSAAPNRPPRPWVAGSGSGSSDRLN